MKKIITAITLFLIITSPVAAQEEYAEVSEENHLGVITGIRNYDCVEGSCTDYEIKIKDKENVTITISPIEQTSIEVKEYELGDKVILLENEYAGQSTFFLIDHVRETPVYILSLLFIVIVVLVGKFKGFKSLLSLIFSCVILFYFVIPMISNGLNPFLVGILGSIVIAVPSIYLSHGFERKSSIAIMGTIASILIVVILAVIFTNLLKLSGFSSEEAMYLIEQGGELNMKGILLASLIFGGIGILDDVTVSQVSVVNELAKSNENLNLVELYKKAMNVGQDHISSMVNTLFIAYAAGTMPLVLLLSKQNVTFVEIISNEPIAEEILRTMVGSIGLVLAVPITTALAVYFYKRK